MSHFLQEWNTQITFAYEIRSILGLHSPSNTIPHVAHPSVRPPARPAARSQRGLTQGGVDQGAFHEDAMKTPGLPGRGRGEEVIEWLRTQASPTTPFVILDDGHESSFEACGLRSKLVKV
jgi:hypothetical protein